MYRAAFALTATLATLAAAVPAQAADDPEYLATIERTAGMVADESVRALVQRHGLDLVDVTWEDTGRYENSAVGGNISDLSIQVQHCAQPDDLQPAPDAGHPLPELRGPHRRRAARRPQGARRQPVRRRSCTASRCASCSATCAATCTTARRGRARAPRCWRRATRTRWSARRRPSCRSGPAAPPSSTPCSSTTSRRPARRLS